MSCSEHEKYNRAKDLQRMKILGTQIASVLNKSHVIVERIHGVYGKYYEVIPKDSTTEKVLFVIEPVSPVELQPSDERKPVKRVNDKRKPDEGGVE